MINIAYFSLDDIRFPCPAIRVFGPNLLLRSAVTLIGGHAVRGDQLNADPAALDKADIVLVQRGFPRSVTGRICEKILLSGKPVIYETDDALQHRPKHHNKRIYETDVGPAIEGFVKHVDLVSVSTPTLAEVFQSLARRVVVLPNYLSPDLWTEDLMALREPDSKRVRIGFIGSTNHDRDFATVVPLLKEALAKYPNVEVVSYGGISGGLEGSPRFSVIPPNYNYAEHPRRLAFAEIDIGLAPLTPSRFNRCKSNIKFLEFGFLGIPGVFADLEPYRGTVIHGETGFLGDARPASWREALFTLIENRNLRDRIGRAAQEVVRNLWMLDAHKDKWLHAYSLAVKAHSGSTRKVG